MAEPEEKVNSRTVAEVYEIADQLCNFVWDYDLTMGELMVIANLVPTILMERVTRINMHKDLIENDNATS